MEQLLIRSLFLESRRFGKGEEHAYTRGTAPATQEPDFRKVVELKKHGYENT